MVVVVVVVIEWSMRFVVLADEVDDDGLTEMGCGENDMCTSFF